MFGRGEVWPKNGVKWRFEVEIWPVAIVSRVRVPQGKKKGQNGAKNVVFVKNPSKTCIKVVFTVIFETFLQTMRQNHYTPHGTT